MEINGPQSRPGSSLPKLIGHTPLVGLEKAARGLSGITLPGKTLLDASSGNTGIALAMPGAAEGFPVHPAMPVNVSPERKRILRAQELACNHPALFREEE